MIQKWLEQLARPVYICLRRSRLAHVCFPKAVQSDMQALGKEEEAYYVQKLSFVCGLLLAGVLLVIAYLVSAWLGNRNGIKQIERPEAYEEAQEIILKAGKQEDVFQLEVEPVLLTREEADAQLMKLLEQWDSYILGENESFEQVKKDLVLPEFMEGYPFEIYWKSDQENLVDSTGVVNREDLSEDTIVMLTATFYYRDWVWTEQFGVLVQKEILTEEERYTRELGRLLTEAEEAQRESKELELPDSFRQETLYYQEVEEDYTILLLVVLVLVAGIAVWIGQDQDLHNSRRKRQEAFQTEYVSFAGSLSLYISAGLNLQTALQFCTQDYIKRKPKEHLLRSALMEFQKDIQNGYGFLEALERFIEAADDVNYRRLAGLLSQGMVNGAQGLAVLLEKEVDKTREEKRRQSKATGEQISTALIAPMMLQLGIVIALIMIPAFTNMQF